MKTRLKNMITGTPAEPAARWLWNRLRRSSGEAELTREDQWTFAILQRLLRLNSNCLDVGCAQGQILTEIVRLAPRGLHHAFEPIPESARNLRLAFPAVRIHEVALSDSNGESTFRHVLSNPGYSGLRQREYPRNDETIKTLQVQTRKLDDAIAPDHRVDFIKIDVEGAELHVLRGGERTIRTWKPHVLFEHGKGAAEYYGTTPEMVYDFLVDVCDLRVSLLPDWLADSPPLNRTGFVDMFGGEHWYFLAHPTRA